MRLGQEPGQSRRQVRVLGGPMSGMCFPIRCRVDIGRASTSDIQLLDDDVSRYHASVMENIHGEHLLVDLDSCNGTLVKGEPIQRVKLVPGMTFEVLDTRFIYEDAPEDHKLVSAEHVREGAEDLPKQDSRATRLIDSRSVELASEAPAAGHREVAQVDEHWAGVADDDGIAYDGNLVEDVIEFRRLRSLHIRKLSGREDIERLERLYQRLRSSDDSGSIYGKMTGYRRFLCSAPATLFLASGVEIPVLVVDFGAGGAQIFSQELHLAPGVLTWLRLSTTVQGRRRTSMFTGDVKWSRGDYVGLRFTGEPRGAEEDLAVTKMNTRSRVRRWVKTKDGSSVGVILGGKASG